MNFLMNFAQYSRIYLCEEHQYMNLRDLSLTVMYDLIFFPSEFL